MNIKKKNITFREISIHQTIIRRLKLSLVFTCVLHSSISTARCGHFDLDDVNEETYVQNYNKLPTVETNDNLLKESPHFNSFLKEAEELIVHYELESYLGLRLIHSHFPVKHNQLMVEEYQSVENIPSLVTYAQDIETAKGKNAIPASWIFGDKEEEIHVFEASTDISVKSGVKLLQENQEFMNELEILLKNNNLNHLLSLAVLKRKSLEANEDQMYMEINVGQVNKSIIQLWNIKNNPTSSIQTSWSFKGPRQLACLPSSRCVLGLNDQHITWFEHR